MREAFKDIEKFRILLEHISDGILAIDKDGHIIYANKTAARLLKRKPGTLIEKNIRDEFPESAGHLLYKAFDKAMRSQKRITVEEHSNAIGKWIRASINPSPKGIIVYVQDITNQRTAEKKAKKSEENFQLFLDRITDGFIALDKNFNYVYVNKKIGELVHRDPASLIGKNVWKEFPDAVNSLTFKAFQTAMKEQRFISNIDYYEPLQLWQENYIYPSPEGLSIFIKDISDKKKLEKELRENERNRQFELMITAMEAQEKERTEMGRELHDNVNQMLVATKLMLAIIRDNEEIKNKTVISRCISTLEKAIDENRRISHELVTPDLKDESLVEQLKSLTQGMFAPNKIAVKINAPGFNELLLDESKKLAVYRIAQEQCTNILKYAKAKKVTIRLSVLQEQFTMSIADDGVGMEEPTIAEGIGLRNIAARAGFLGGLLHINTSPGKGFKLQVSFPTGATMPVHSLYEST